MKLSFFVGIVIFGTFLIVNVHAGREGLRNRKLKSSKPATTTKDYVYQGALPAYGAQGTPAVPAYPYPDPSYEIDDDNGCCLCPKKKHKNPFANVPNVPIGDYPPGTGYLPPVAPVGYYPPDAPAGYLPPSDPISIPPPTGPINIPPPADPVSPPPAVSNIVGFAQQFNTVGGQGGEVVTINSLNDLIQNVGDDNPRILMINSNIKADDMTKVQMGSFKSIIGLNGNATLYNIYLRATNTSQNIIFQNLIFQHAVENKGNDDIQLYLNFGRAYLIDHCSFVGHKWSPGDGSDDKLLYIGEQASGATISNCYFGNHNYGLIFGHPNDNVKKAGDDDTRVTICNNHFENLADRAPGLFRFGQYHVYNNYINNYGLGFTVATNGYVISEYNFFGSSPNKNAMLDDKGSGEFMDTGSVPPIANAKSPKPHWSPSYAYNLKTTSDPGVLNSVQRYVLKRINPAGLADSRLPRPLLFPPPMQLMTSHFPALH